ncbi:MAG: efflux RND transporter periplasmic adaptor subunit [Candidatus Cryptobacteroides sp.]|nr:efflux RND transporter periplasmic adaptor subunit [Bacteroidales bacterium]MDD7134421.1 efflux RND transporter periplasmic adaptor subunit [Bacteroidales bacterium]MDY2773950.1 efflux RND transporter periplasmic adaptor subunit [Candidatus Cryptobacteroides sp.]
MEKTQKKGNIWIGIGVLVALIAAVSVLGIIFSRPKEAVIQGEAEAAEYRISGKVPGRIEAFYAAEGDMVHKGDTLVLIDSPEVRAKLAQANAAYAAAAAQRNKANTGARKEEIAGAYEIWQKALVGKDIAKKTLDRATRLHEQKVISDQKFDEATAQYNAAAATAEAAKSQYDMAVKGAREEDKAAAIALVDRANGAVMEVKSYLSELKLTSPVDGVISARYPHVGELVGTGSPIMTVTDLSDMWFTFNIREDKLHSMKSGDKLRLSIPALDGKEIDATVTYIAARESYATWRATKETDQYDAKTFEVRAVPVSKVEGLRPGMTAIVVGNK